VPKLGPFKELLGEWLEQDAKLPKKQRRTAMRLFEGLKDGDYEGAYDSVQRFVKAWKEQRQSEPSVTQPHVPLAFAPGDVGQFDWSEETALRAGAQQRYRQRLRD